MEPGHRLVPIFATLLAGAALGCTNMTYDDGSGPVDAENRPVAEVDGVDPSDAEWETESNNEVMLEESAEDAWKDANR